MKWQCKRFTELTQKELYQILKLRNAVFVVEQNCAYQDCDDKDEFSFHFFAQNNSTEIICYARILPPAISYENYASIGRVITNIDYRNKGLGKELMLRSIEITKKHFPNWPIKIGAQQYLEKFYSGLGFVTTSDMYLEDGIPHVEMVLK